MNPNPTFAQRYRVLFLLGLFALSMVFLGGKHLLNNMPLYYKDQAETFRVRMKQYVNISEIQTWMARQTKPAKAEFVGPDDWPDCIKKIPEPRFWVRFDGVTLEIEEGNGFGHWGMRVGTPGNRPPKNFKEEYQLPLTDDAYVFHEIQ